MAHDMVLSIDSPHPLLDLLRVREARALEPRGADLPPLLAETPAPSTAVAPGDRVAWRDLWPFLWDAALEQAADRVDADVLPRLQAAAPGSRRRADLRRDVIGPTWRDRFGDAAFDERYVARTAARFEAVAAARPARLEDEPERRCLQALVPAWRAGLTAVVTIPCRGGFIRVIGAHALLVMDGTRTDPARYTEALTTFEQEAPPRRR